MRLQSATNACLIRLTQPYVDDTIVVVMQEVDAGLIWGPVSLRVVVLDQYSVRELIQPVQGCAAFINGLILWGLRR